MTFGACHDDVYVVVVYRTQAVTQVGISEDSGRPVEGAGLVPNLGFTKVGFNVLDVCVSPCGRYLAVSTDHSYHFLYKLGTSNIIKCGLCLLACCDGVHQR